MRSSLILPLLLIAVACGRSTTEPVTLTTEQVGGQYHVCALEFVPDGGFPPRVDILHGQIDAGSDPAPRLYVSRQVREFELWYIPADDDLPRRLGTEYELGAGTVTLTFSNTEQELRRLLLPSALELDFSAEPRTLTISDHHHRHTVRRADYERITGETHPNVADPVRGRLEGRFQVDGCDAG